MSSINESLRHAIAHHRSGRLRDAEALYRQVLGADPANADALQLLGVLALQSGQPAAAADLIRQALGRRPADPQGNYNLGNALQALGDAEGAMAAFRKAVAFAPQMAEAHGNLGTLLAMGRRFDEAIPVLREAVRRAPRYVQGWNSLGNALRESGRLDEAIESYRKALLIDRDFTPSQFGIGLAYAQSGRYAEAERAYREVLRRTPDNSDVWNNLGTLMRLVGRPEEALACFDRVVALMPASAPGHYNRGLVLADLERIGEAEAAQRRALALDGALADAWDSLGVALQNQQRLEESIACYRRALALQPRHAVAATNYGTALQAQGRHAEAIAAFEVALQANPGLAATRSNRLMTLQYMTDQTPASILAAARDWAAAHAAPVSTTFANPRDPDRPLRIGYVSADFRNHSCAWFLEPLLAAHDRANFAVIAFFGANQSDAATERFRALAQGWHETARLSDAELIDLIRREAIDIVVDCGGHTAANRLPALSAKPAPVQVTWLGFPATTGVPAIDYRFTDAVADPPGSEAHATEELVRLPAGFLCYRPPTDAPPVTLPPSGASGTVAFGSFNNPSKINDGVIAAWSRILAAVVNGRLILKAKQFSDAGTRGLFLERFVALGVDAGRIELLPAVQSVDAHLAHYGRVDVALDPFPYNGTTTTCEALWMGVPVVTWRGNRHAARVGASVLAQVGLDELVADDVDGYVAKAVSLAGDPARLAWLRAGLRARVSASPLTDAAAFARHVEAAYREMWRTWCRAAG